MKMSNQADNDNQGEEKLEDILRSIRNIIDDRESSDRKPPRPKPQHIDDSVLELTTVFREEDSLVSGMTLNKSSAVIKDFATKLDTHSYKSENNLDIVITDLIKPLLKDWMDNNLTKLVERVVAEEIRRLVPKG